MLSGIRTLISVPKSSLDCCWKQLSVAAPLCCLLCEIHVVHPASTSAQSLGFQSYCTARAKLCHAELPAGMLMSFETPESKLAKVIIIFRLLQCTSEVAQC